MRVFVPQDGPVVIADLTGERNKGVMIRAITGGVVFYLATGNPTELMNVAPGGVPDGGIPLENVTAPVQFNFFADKIYGRSTGIDGYVDVQKFNNS